VPAESSSVIMTAFTYTLLTFISYFLTCDLRGPLADCHETLPHNPQFCNLFGEHFPPKLGGNSVQNAKKFRTTLEILIANISGTEQDIENLKMALQTTHFQVRWYNLVNFGQQRAKNIGLKSGPTQNQHAGQPLCYAIQNSVYSLSASWQ